MRVWIIACVAVLAGCMGAPAPTAEPTTNATLGTPGDVSNATGPAPPVGERMPVAMERFALLANGTLGVLASDAAPMPQANVPEPARPTAFYEGFATPLTLTPWPSFPFGRAFETTGDIEIMLSFTSASTAVATNPKPAGFPAVGAWFGTPDRFAFFLLATDAPDSLEAGKVYTVKLHAAAPPGGFFVRPGEQLALHPFLSYQTADGQPVSYVVGGADPAGFVLPHQHFNLSADRAAVLVEKTGELGPNPGPTSDMQQQPVDLAFTVPPEVVYVVMEVEGAPKAGTRVDIDLSARTPGGESVASGSSPFARELVVLGPGNLAASGRDLVARVASSSSAGGATWTLRITTYGP